ncbi:putative heme/steroid binding domain protein [Cladophialophora carrionii]|uniref:Putative heme/steroid binding domain protein n=1 Tax=Cladophialophora carrionii TaxID=86049 RepID=A0A1C1CP38_9EURO|nr:putative heme/steroid binding domain protein [Cladophialophora carrionii]
MSDSATRRRRPKVTSSASKAAAHLDDQPEDTNSRVISLLDVLRLLLTLVFASCLLSYYLTSGASFTFNYSPWFLNASKLSTWWSGPLLLTPAQLALYNGTDPSKPIYLAINSTIFDVTAGKHTYGPGGSYEVFAGRDATRAFVTGCFLEDRTGDLRGAEWIYLPIEDDPDEDISSGARKLRAEKERRDAKKKVLTEVSKWEEFYRNHQKYFEVGKLVGVPEYAGEAPKLCEPAEKGRPKRKNMNVKKDKKDQKDAPGKPVQ